MINEDKEVIKFLYVIRFFEDMFGEYINFRNFMHIYNRDRQGAFPWMNNFYTLLSKVIDPVNLNEPIIYKNVSPFINKYSAEPTLDRILSIVGYNGILAGNIFGLYQYGSRVYGCATEKSDFDYILVVDTPLDKQEIIEDNININMYCLAEFLQRIALHEIDALECAYLPMKHVLIDKLQLSTYLLNKSILRNSISEKSSHSFVKAKKKLTIDKDFNPYIGKKSLFHSLRIINFGTQIAKDGRISDYSAANNYWDEIVNNPINDWQYYKEKYQPIYNKMMTEFRKLAPKEIIK